MTYLDLTRERRPVCTLLTQYPPYPCRDGISACQLDSHPAAASFIFRPWHCVLFDLAYGLSTAWLGSDNASGSCLHLDLRELDPLPIPRPYRRRGRSGPRLPGSILGGPSLSDRLPGFLESHVHGSRASRTLPRGGRVRRTLLHEGWARRTLLREGRAKRTLPRSGRTRRSLLFGGRLKVGFSVFEWAVFLVVGLVARRLFCWALPASCHSFISLIVP